MTGWEQQLLAMFDDLEQQAEGLALADRDARVADLARAGYAEIDLMGRLHGGVGCPVSLVVAGLGRLEGTLARAGADWLLLVAGRQEWLVRVAALEAVLGLPERVLAEDARPVTARLGLGSVLRSLAEDAVPVVVHRTGGSLTRARIRRVGADFVELEPAEPAGPGETGAGAGRRLEVVPWRAVAAVRRD